MSVAYQSNTTKLTAFNGAAGGNHNVNPPSGLAAGELWVIWAVLDVDPGAAISLPSGWTAIGSQQTGGEGWPVVRAFYKVAAASESAVNVAFTGGGYDFWCASIRISGQHASTPIGNIASAVSSGNGNTFAAPSVTVQDDGNLVLLFYAAEGDDGGAETVAQPSGSTVIVEREGAVFPVGSTAYRARDTGPFAPGNWVASRPDTDILNGVALTIEIRAAAEDDGSGDASGSGASAAASAPSGEAAQTNFVGISGVSHDRLVNGQTGIVVTVAGASLSGNRVVISAADDIDDVSAVEQTITAEGTTSVTFTAVRGSLALSTDFYLFVENANGYSNAAGYPIRFRPGSAVINEILVGPDNQPLANLTDIRMLIYRLGRISGTFDQEVEGKETDEAGALSCSINVGALEAGDPVFYVADLGNPPTAYTCGVVVPTYS